MTDLPSEKASSIRTCLVVPCFNEGLRLEVEKFDSLIRDTRVNLLFVNDGSTDSTLQKISEIQQRNPLYVDVISLGTNSGKGEAIRVGLLKATSTGYDQVGFMDADFAVPTDEVARFLGEINRFPDKCVFFGSRVQLLGAEIFRTFKRYLFGRIFATLASVSIKENIYDTQCGMKVFRTNLELIESLQKRFRTRWLFDLELIKRLNQNVVQDPNSSWIRENGIEIPLRKWNEVEGSKFSFVAQIRTFLQLVILIKESLRFCRYTRYGKSWKLPETTSYFEFAKYKKLK